MVDGANALMTAAFGPVLGMPPVLAEIVIASAVTLVITLLYRLLSDPKKLKELRDRTKEINAKVKELQKTNPEAASKMTNEMLEITNKQMMASMKPMLATLLVASLFFPWMAATFTGPIVKLPAEVPLFGADLGWLMWYIVISIPVSQIFRKLMGVDI